MVTMITMIGMIMMIAMMVMVCCWRRWLSKYCDRVSVYNRPTCERRMEVLRRHQPQHGQRRKGDERNPTNR
jgi:hypothetical protein